MTTAETTTTTADLWYRDFHIVYWPEMACWRVIPLTTAGTPEMTAGSPEDAVRRVDAWYAR